MDEPQGQDGEVGLQTTTVRDALLVVTARSGPRPTLRGIGP